MTTSDHHPSPQPGAPIALMDDVIERLALLLSAADPGAQPALVGIELDDDVRVHLRPCLDPAEDLQGWTAPSSWDLLGTTAPATMRRWSESDQGCDADATVTHTTITHLLAREGRSVTVIGDPETHDVLGEAHILRSSDAVPGLTSDACRRAMHLPTAPATVHAPEAVAILWLDAIAAAATRTPGLDDVACWHLHPALPLAAAGSSRDLAARCLAATESVTWSFLREQAVRGAPPVHVVPSVASWCDEGAFSRLVLAALPELDDLFEALESLVPVGVAARLLGTVERYLR